MVGLLDQGQSEQQQEGQQQEGQQQEGQQQGAAAERPDWLPEDLWGDAGFNAEAFEALKAGTAKAADLPESADAYVLPTIDGFDADKAGASPLFSVMRNAAHKAGIGQAGFDELITDYVAGEKAKSDEVTAAEMAALGANAKARLGAVAAFLNGNLPKDLAEAVGATLTSAKAVQGIEKLMGLGKPGGGTRADPPPPVTRKSREEIDKLMSTPAYSGRADERDPKVIKEVDDWFQAEYGQKK